MAYVRNTERAYKNKFWNEFRDGLYKSVASGEILFSSKDKYDAGTGWPTFSRPAPQMGGKKSCIVEIVDFDLTYLMYHTKVECITDGVHLGSLFDDGPSGPGQTGLRYCMNSGVMTFIPKEKLSKKEREFYFPE